MQKAPVPAPASGPGQGELTGGSPLGAPEPGECVVAANGDEGSAEVPVQVPPAGTLVVQLS